MPGLNFFADAVKKLLRKNKCKKISQQWENLGRFLPFERIQIRRGVEVNYRCCHLRRAGEIEVIC